MDSALALAKCAWENGTRKIFLTPHFSRRFKRESLERYQEAFSYVQSAIYQRFPELEVYLGSEVAFELDVPRLLSDGKVLSMNNSEFVLLELKSGMNSRGIVNAVYETIMNGFTPILAHVDRYEQFRNEAGLVDEVMENGALIQINADSVLGKNGFSVKRYCGRLLRENKVHFISSDAHDVRKRSPNLRPCYEYVRKRFGEDTAQKLFSQNAEVLLANRSAGKEV